ncbi:calcium-binding protein [Halovulum sp. GXIMD14793]
MLTIRATDIGFHIRSPLDQPLAPNVFLNAPVNASGTILFDPEMGGWITEESLRYSEFGVMVEVGSLTNGSVTVTGVTYGRMVDGQMQVIGMLDLGAGLTVATYLDNPLAGAFDTYFADIGAALADLLQSDGFRFIGGAGADVFDPGRMVLPTYGPVVLLGRGGDDILHGGRTDDVIRGGSGDDILIDNGGTNDLRGGHGDDVIRLGVWSEGSVARGGGGDDLLVSSNGSDRLHGGRGDDRIEGHRGNDVLAGSWGNDWLDGGEGADRLRGGAGDDVLTGGWGADRFVFRSNQPGNDRITDFEDGQDRIVLRGVAGGFAGLDMAETEAGVVITLDEDSTILVQDVTLDQMDADDFIF